MQISKPNKTAQILSISFLGLVVLLGAAPTQAQPAPGFFKADGINIVDSTGTPVVLRGIGLGGWLVPEGYMLHIEAANGGSPSAIRAQIEDLIGVADADIFYEKYRANYVDEKDIAAIAEWGFDHIRLPLHYNILFDPDTETFIEDGFTLLDTFIEWCRTYGIYVIFDMHAAPGAQSDGGIADSDGVARLWTEPVPYQDQLVEIWSEIARRYVDEKLVIGYDLINEPVTPDGFDGPGFRGLYTRLADSIRTIDQNHILFIEGNFFATTFGDLEPPFDDNMVYSFHKYWNGTAINSIQYLLDLRDRTNVPLWLGETGENSNPWFSFMSRLMTENNIGWNFWTHKKIESTTSPTSAPFVPGYESVLNYWRGSAGRPTAAAARDALFAMAEGLDLDSTVVRHGVLPSLFDPNFSTLRMPFADHVIPGNINAVDYDIGSQGQTYSDSDVMATTGQPGGGNNGAQYRNDGVDIERSTDPLGFEYNVGWTEAFEFLTYTVNVETTGRYDVEARVASNGGGGEIRLFVDDERLGDDLSVNNTGGWQNWISVFTRDVTLTAGEHILKVLVRSGGFNLNQLNFTLVAPIAVEDDTQSERKFKILGSYPNPFADDVRVSFSAPSPVNVTAEVFDVLGRRVFSLPTTMYQPGEHSLELRPELADGSYMLRLRVDDGTQTRAFTSSIVVVR